MSPLFLLTTAEWDTPPPDLEGSREKAKPEAVHLGDLSPEDRQVE